MSSNQQLLLSDAPDGPARGCVVYSSTATQEYTWYPPAGVTKVSAVVVGGGTENGGALSYKNNITVSAGNGYAVRVSSDSTGSYFIGTSTVYAGGGSNSAGRTGDGGGNGGPGYTNYSNGGGGAGGYSGTGGAGGNGFAASGIIGNGGGGGGGGAGTLSATCWVFSGGYWKYTEYAGGGGGGGGTQLYGAAASGNGGPGGTIAGGGGSFGFGGSTIGAYSSNGSSGGNATPSSAANGGNGGSPGGGRGAYGLRFTYRSPTPCFCDPCFTFCSGGTGSNGVGGAGAVRIVWPGCARSFPSTDVGTP